MIVPPPKLVIGTRADPDWHPERLQNVSKTPVESRGLAESKSPESLAPQKPHHLVPPALHLLWRRRFQVQPEERFGV